MRCEAPHTLQFQETIFIANVRNFEGLPKNYKKSKKSEISWRATYDDIYLTEKNSSEKDEFTK